MRSFFAGLPLAMLGFGCLWKSKDDTEIQWALVLMAAFYLIAAFCTLSPSRTMRNVTIVAWFPLLFAFPIGTAWGALAIAWLSRGAGAERQKRQLVAEVTTPEELATLVHRRAAIALDISEDQRDVPVEQEMMIPPVDWITFLDDLRIDHGLPISSADRKFVASVDDVVRRVTERLFPVASPSLVIQTGEGWTSEAAAAPPNPELSPYHPPSPILPAAPRK